MFKYHSSFSNEHPDKPDQYVLNFLPVQLESFSIQIATEKHGDIKMSALPGGEPCTAHPEAPARVDHPGSSGSVHPDQKVAL